MKDDTLQIQLSDFESRSFNDPDGRALKVNIMSISVNE